ncbi:MAG: circadian clock protein KaiC [Stagnimonas sp.]|nr:circadian clock protein KaiC [Stagnimonas sp.]
MAKKSTPKSTAVIGSLAKCPTGIRGLDEITGGGLPRGRPSLVCGNAGCGKTILGMEFLVHGARDFGEPGVFMSFEEGTEELEKNFASLGVDLQQMVKGGQLSIDYVHIERSEIEETGEYDLDGLFVRLGYAIDSIGAKRVVLDTIEALFTGFTNTAILRAELRRLFRWLKEKGVTAVITGERGDRMLTRHGLEEYVADCVILLDLRVDQQVATRRLRVVKYRGTTHGTDEYPFLIDERGISILPITSLGLDHAVSHKRVSSGIARLDTMLGGQGYYRGSVVLVSGTAGSGKSSLAARFVEAACERGEQCLYFAFEESPQQIVRNMASIGCDLGRWQQKGLLHFHASRPSLYGLEMHLATLHKQVALLKPQIVVIDPISNLTAVGTGNEAKSMLTRLIDFLKTEQISTLMTDLTHAGNSIESSSEEISSLVDSWICLRDIEHQGERNRGLHILKSRGMPHSNQVREFLMSDKGMDLMDVYIGPAGMVTGSARLTQEALERANAVSSQQQAQRQQRDYERRRALLEANIAAMRLEFETTTQDMHEVLAQDAERVAMLEQGREQLARSRKADAKPAAAAAGAKAPAKKRQ